MNRLIKYKIGLTLTAMVAGLCLLVPATGFAMQGDPVSSGTKEQAVQAMTCKNNEVPIDGGRSCCPKSAGSNPSSCLYAKYINPVVNLLSAAVGVVVVAAIIMGAIQFSTSGGDPQKAANGKKHIQNALLGLVAYILLFGFLQFIIPGGLLNATK